MTSMDEPKPTRVSWLPELPTDRDGPMFPFTFVKAGPPQLPRYIVIRPEGVKVGDQVRVLERDTDGVYREIPGGVRVTDG